MSGRNNFGEPLSKQSQKKINIYCEHSTNKFNEFRAAESRLQKNITVSFEFIGNNRIPNPIKTSRQVFHCKPEFFHIVNKNRLFEPSPMQSQAWPVILSGEDFIGIGGDEKDQRLAFVLPALLHIEKQREHRLNRELTAVCISESSDSVLQIGKEINETFRYKDIKCECIDDNYDETTLKLLKNKEIEAIAATPVNLHKIIEAGILSSVSYLVLDKLDKILESQKEIIFSLLEKVSLGSQIIIMSNTFCTSLEQLRSKNQLHPIVVRVSFPELPSINEVTQQFKYNNDEEEKLIEVIDYLQKVPSEERVVVFCNDEFTAMDLLGTLTCAKIKCETLLVNTTNEERKKILKKLKDSSFQVLITNDCDLDMASFRHRYIYNVPKSIDKYIDLISQGRGDYPNITTVAILSDNDWIVGPDMIAILRQTKQVVPPILFDLSNRFKPVEFAEHPTFSHLSKLETFVDKSMIIKDIVKNNDNFLFTAPRKMGKTSILKMLEFFQYKYRQIKSITFQKTEDWGPSRYYR